MALGCDRKQEGISGNWTNSSDNMRALPAPGAEDHSEIQLWDPSLANMSSSYPISRSGSDRASYGAAQRSSIPACPLPAFWMRGGATVVWHSPSSYRTGWLYDQFLYLVFLLSLETLDKIFSRFSYCYIVNYYKIISVHSNIKQQKASITNCKNSRYDMWVN